MGKFWYRDSIHKVRFRRFQVGIKSMFILVMWFQCLLTVFLEPRGSIQRAHDEDAPLLARGGGGQGSDTH